MELWFIGQPALVIFFANPSGDQTRFSRSKVMRRARASSLARSSTRLFRAATGPLLSLFQRDKS